MNLKKAFQYQKALKELASELAYECTEEKYFLKITEEHHKEELNKMNSNYSYAMEEKDLSDLELGKYDLKRLIEIYNAIVNWRTTLALGISKAKAGLEIGPDKLDYDAAIIYANDQRCVITYYDRLANMRKYENERSEELALATDCGSAEVHYTVKRRGEPLPETVEVASEARRLLKAKLESISDEIEEATLTTKIEEQFVPPIPLNIDFEDLYKHFEDYK